MAAYSLRPYQEEIVETALANLLESDDKPVLHSLTCGCHAKGHPILMADGTLRPVENVCVGEHLMGPNGVRTVLRLCRGEAQMFHIVPKKGKPFIVNGNHILHLRRFRRRMRNGKTTYSKEYVDISVIDFLKQNPSWQRSATLCRSGYAYGNTVPTFLDPWVVGAYLGDGLTFDLTCRETVFFNADMPVIERMRECVEKNGWHLKTSDKDPIRHSILCGGKHPSPFKKELIGLGCLQEQGFRKQFPKGCLAWDEESRLRLLAGFLDTDGSYNRQRNCFDFVCKQADIGSGVMRLARSLGLGAYCKESWKKAQTMTQPKKYYRVCISGHGQERIPCCKWDIRGNRQVKSQCVTGFSVEELEKDTFYGFELDGDHLYLDGELIVHHNSGKSWIAAEIAQRWRKQDLGKVLVLTLSKELCQQDYDKLEIVAGGENVGMFSASWGRRETETLTVATVQSAYRHPELWKDYTLVIADEADSFQPSGMCGKLFEKRYVYGITGTPFGAVGSRKGSWYTTKLWPMSKIKDKKYGWFWQPISYELSAKDMLEMGYHTPLKIYASPIKCNLLRLQSNGSEYTLESLDRWIQATLRRVLEVMQQAEAGGYCHSGIVFLPSVESCMLLENECKKRAVSARALHAKTPSRERLKIVNAHKAGELTWLINVGVCARGFDNPAVDCLVIARPTGSLRTHVQCLGRGCRLAEGKTFTNVFDLTENTKRWGNLPDLEMGKKLQNGYEQDTILLRGKDISGIELSKINLMERKNVNAARARQSGTETEEGGSNAKYRF